MRAGHRSARAEASISTDRGSLAWIEKKIGERASASKSRAIERAVRRLMGQEKGQARG